jgi:hypothetical protein
VRRRRPTKLGIIGTALAALGGGGLTWGTVDEFQPERFGILFLIIGIGIIGFQKLERRNLASNEIYNTGRERGEADGYDQGYRDGLIDGERNRPVVVPFPGRCQHCGHDRQPAAAERR